MSRTWLFPLFLALLSGCAVMSSSPAPSDWPVLRVVRHDISNARVRNVCNSVQSGAPWFAHVEACTFFRFDLAECHMVFSNEFPPSAWFVDHELAHCAGADHVGSVKLADAWAAWKVRP